MSCDEYSMTYLRRIYIIDFIWWIRAVAGGGTIRYDTILYHSQRLTALGIVATIDKGSTALNNGVITTRAIFAIGFGSIDEHRKAF
jgi:hypothetical protein